MHGNSIVVSAGVERRSGANLLRILKLEGGVDWEDGQTETYVLQFSARLAAPEAEAAHTATLVRFGTFELDLRAGELRKGGAKLRLGGQPLQVLAILLESPGKVVTRDELQKRLWPDTFVDVDHNLNTAVNKIREVPLPRADFGPGITSRLPVIQTQSPRSPSSTRRKLIT
jgi:DNA-binding response OmpR family regulator